VQPLTYAYNQQIHRTTGFAPFALALPHPPTNPVSALFQDQAELTRVELPLSAENDSTANSAVEANRARTRIRTMIETARLNTAAAQARYKQHFDKRVQFSIKPKKGDTVFIQRPPSSARTIAEKLAEIPHSKLRTKADGPHTVESANEHSVTVTLNGIPEPISIDRVTVRPGPRDTTPPAAPPSAPPVPPATEDDVISPPDVTSSPNGQTLDAAGNPVFPFASPAASVPHTSPARSGPPGTARAVSADPTLAELPAQPSADARDGPAFAPEHASSAAQPRASRTGPATSTSPAPATVEATLDHIVSHHPTTDGDTLFRARWFGHKPIDDTYEPAHHFTPDQLARYWAREQRKNARPAVPARRRRGRRR